MRRSSDSEPPVRVGQSGTRSARAESRDTLDAALNEFGSPQAHDVGNARPQILLQRQDDSGFADHFGKAGPIAGDHWDADLHRLDHRRAEALVFAGEDEGMGHSDEAVAVALGHTPHVRDGPSHPRVGQLLAHGLLGVAGTAHQDESVPEVRPVAIGHVDEEAMSLVGERCGRVHEDRSHTQIELRSQFGLGSEVA
ncbi:MAG: hypothetical protein B7C54_11300 [Acidimicrobiales bacterium mtb01]|nr:hypothetical protein [Actinomycetota bacterium]TEX45636.1 MAG: hypothetical protein B7C54_11300 [Acidimicrobiales bacterium mtb01]